MMSDTCGAQSLQVPYSAAPKCFLTWHATGTLTNRDSQGAEHDDHDYTDELGEYGHGHGVMIL